MASVGSAGATARVVGTARPPRAARQARAGRVVCASQTKREAQGTHSRRWVASLLLGGVAAGVVAPQYASAVECSIWGAVTCYPAPPKGEPRYKTFDGPLYDPAKAAVERLKAKQAAEAGASAPEAVPAPSPAPAPSPEAPAE